MVVITKKIKKQAKYEDEIMFFNQKKSYKITEKIIGTINNISKKQKIIYFSSSYSEKELKEMFNIFKQENICIIDNILPDIKKIENYIKDERNVYMVIDHLNMEFRDENFYIDKYTLGEVFHYLKIYLKNYNINFLIIINKIK